MRKVKGMGMKFLRNTRRDRIRNEESSRRPKTSSTPLLLTEAVTTQDLHLQPRQPHSLSLHSMGNYELVVCSNPASGPSHLDSTLKQLAQSSSNMPRDYTQHDTNDEHTKIIAQQWQKLEPSAKQMFEEEFKKEMIHYLAVCVSYENSLTDQQKEDLQKAKEEIVESKQQKQLKMKKKELGKPKKPLSAFLIFFQEKIKLKGDTPFKVWQQKLSQEWESLPDEKKAQYLDKASHHWQLYRQELQLWEEKMIRLGHIDVVRNEALIEPRSNK
uniref:HMG box domain-containing protein n=1 Tax=Timema genevievae TaxID=629358 RepID=A0A7R9PNG2_TIMGE|nr:unnamed protein product [Timema genevievae]